MTHLSLVVRTDQTSRRCFPGAQPPGLFSGPEARGPLGDRSLPGFPKPKGPAATGRPMEPPA